MKASPKFVFNAWLGSGAGIFIFSLLYRVEAENLIIGLTIVWVLFIPYIHYVVLPKAKALDESKKK